MHRRVWGGARGVYPPNIHCAPTSGVKHTMNMNMCSTSPACAVLAELRDRNGVKQLSCSLKFELQTTHAVCFKLVGWPETGLHLVHNSELISQSSFCHFRAYLIVYIRAEYQTMYRHDAYMPTLVLNHCFNLDTIHKESKWNVLWRMLAWSLRYSCVYLSWKREPIYFFQVTWKQLSGALEIIRWLVLRVLKLSPYWSMTLFQ